MVYSTKILIYLAIATLMMPASVRVGCCCDNLRELTQQDSELPACPHCVNKKSSNVLTSAGETIHHDCRCKSHTNRSVLIASSSSNKHLSQAAIAWQMKDRLTTVNHKQAPSFAQDKSQGHLPGLLQPLLCRWTT